MEENSLGEPRSWETEEHDVNDYDKELELSDDTDEEAYSPGRLLGVAALGAMLSLGAYYLYQQMDEEKKRALKRKASNLVADQITRLTEVDD